MGLYSSAEEAARPVPAEQFDGAILELLGRIGALTALMSMIFVGRACVEEDPRAWLADRLKEAIDITALLGDESALGAEAVYLIREAAEKRLRGWGAFVDGQIGAWQRLDAAGEPATEARN